MSTAKSRKTPLFDEDFLRKLELLHVVSRKVFTGKYRAERRGKRKGAGIEFADHRDYAPGDDFRAIDWNVYGRMSRLLVRLFEEEEDLSVALLVDASQSMMVGEPLKFDYARRVVAALAYVALANLDRVTIQPFAEALRPALSPRRGRGQIHRVLDFLAAAPPGGETGMEASFRAFAARTKRRGLAVVVSDFFDPRGCERALKLLAHDRFELFAVQVCSPEDARPAVKGDFRLRDAETGEERVAAVTPEVLRAYERAFQNYGRKLEEFCASLQAGFVQTLTSVPFEDLVLRVFREGQFLK